MPDPIVSRADGVDPEHEALLADSVGLALLVVLETLDARRAAGLRAARHVRRAVRRDRARSSAARRPPPASSPAARAAGCRARRPGARRRPRRQRAVVDAFFAAARDGDFDALVAVLDPDVVLRADGGAVRPGATRDGPRRARPSPRGRCTFARLAPYVRPALVNGAAGVVVAPRGRAVRGHGLHRRGGRIVEIDALADPERLRAARPDGPRRLSRVRALLEAA